MVARTNFWRNFPDLELYRTNVGLQVLPMRNGFATRLILVFTVFLSSAIALEITSPDDLASTSFLSPRIWWIGPTVWDFDMEAELVSINSSDIANKFVLSRNYDNSEIEDLWRRNALGAVLYSGHSPLDIPGITNYMLEDPRHDILLPTVTISIFTFDQLRTWIEDEGRNITIRLTSRDPNPWDDVMQSGAMLFFSIFMSAFTLLCIGLASYKLAMFVKAKGCQQSIPQTMLILEIIANTIRFFSCVVDPLQSRGILPYALNQVLFSVHWPFALMNILLISLYWHELMTKTSMNVITFLDKLKIPFWCIFAVILASEFTAGMLRGFGLAIKVFRNPFVALACGYMLIGLACVIFYIYTGTKLTLTMRRSSAELMASNKVKRLNRTSKYIYASSAGVICWLIAIAIGGLTDALWLPWGYFGVWFAQFFLTPFISLTQQLAIQEPNSICARNKMLKGSSDARTSHRLSTKPTQMATLSKDQNQSVNNSNNIEL